MRLHGTKRFMKQTRSTRSNSSGPNPIYGGSVYTEAISKPFTTNVDKLSKEFGGLLGKGLRKKTKKVMLKL